MTDRVVPAGLIALLSGYEAGPPTRAQLEAASDTPTEDLLFLSSDATRRGAVQHGAIRALGALGTAPALERLEVLLATDAEPSALRAAIQGAAMQLAVDGLADRIAGHLHHEDPGVARAAVLALAGHAPSRPALEALEEQELAPPVLAALNQALGRESAAPTVPTAVPASDDADRTPGGR